MCLHHLEKYVESDVYFRKMGGISVADLLSIKDLCFLRKKVHVLTLVNVILSIRFYHKIKIQTLTKTVPLVLKHLRQLRGNVNSA